jgi:hypothetical protein
MIPKVELINDRNVQSAFIAPSVDHDMVIIFRLSVTDDQDASDSTVVSVKITKDAQPQPSSNLNAPPLPSQQPNEPQADSNLTRE